MLLLGYREIWTDDRNLLIQIFTNPDTDEVERVTVHHRSSNDEPWHEWEPRK